jgi:two-component system, OmpR family, sensor histidine kinase CreC
MIRLVIVSATAIAGILFVAFVASRVARSRQTGLSIRMQVFLALALVVGAFAAGLGVMVLDRIQARAVRFAVQSASEEARSIARLLAIQIEHSGTGLSSVAEALRAQTDADTSSSWRLLDPQGRALFHRPPLEDDGPYMSVAAPVIVHGSAVGSVEVLKPTVVMERLLTDFAPTVLVISLVLGAAAALSAAWIGRSIAAPIEALSRFSERVSRGEQGAQPPPAPWGREVTRLTHSIDSMRRQLEGRPFVEMFAADLSHELKNPVAAIRASAEVLEEGALGEPEQAARFVRRIREANDRIERVLNDLLHLARMEAGDVEGLERLDLSQVARAALTSLPSSERVVCQTAHEVNVLGARTWLSRALINLLENALIHSAPDSPVELSVVAREGEAHVLVASHGEVHPHVRQNLFRRFVTTREDKGGTGLGLAIVRAVAEAHAGQVRLENPGPPQVVFALSIPLARRQRTTGGITSSAAG